MKGFSRWPGAKGKRREDGAGLRSWLQSSVPGFWLALGGMWGHGEGPLGSGMHLMASRDTEAPDGHGGDPGECRGQGTGGAHSGQWRGVHGKWVNTLAHLGVALDFWLA